MNAMRIGKRKTVKAQREHTAERAPKLELVPDKAGEQHSRATEEGCTATRWLAGHLVICELAARHGGDHHYQGRTWRPRSGDDVDAG